MYCRHAVFGPRERLPRHRIGPGGPAGCLGSGSPVAAHT